eukprot:3952213-Pyramimonas_sp.AAC.1
MGPRSLGSSPASRPAVADRAESARAVLATLGHTGPWEALRPKPKPRSCGVWTGRIALPNAASLPPSGKREPPRARRRPGGSVRGS